MTTDLPTIARAAALNCEAKKYAYRQTKDGVVISFVLHPNEIPKGLTTAAIGSRWVLAMVEIGDDELPKGGSSNLAADLPLKRESQS